MTPERFRRVLALVLLAGVTIAAALMLAGLAGALVLGWRGSLVGAAHATDDVSDFARLPANLVALRPVGLAQLGLVVLVLTPVARVVASIGLFLAEGDRPYAAITAVVLAILVVSLVVLR